VKLFLVRHGETDYNRSNRYQGHSNTALNRTGLRQAKRLQRRLLDEKIDKIYASSLMRAMDTARIIADGRGIEVAASENLVEIGFGRFEGMTYDEIIKEYPEWRPTNCDFTACGGESLDELARRAGLFSQEIHRDNPTGSNILVVSHAGCLRVLLCIILGIDVSEWWRFTVATASISIVENTHLEPVLSLLSDVSHLDDI